MLPNSLTHTKIPLSVNSLNWARATCVRVYRLDWLRRSHSGRRVCSKSCYHAGTDQQSIHPSRPHISDTIYTTQQEYVYCVNTSSQHAHNNRNTHKNTQRNVLVSTFRRLRRREMVCSCSLLADAQHNVVCRLRCAWIFRTMDIFKPHSTQMQTTRCWWLFLLMCDFFFIYATVTPATPKNRSQIERVRYGRKKNMFNSDQA